MAKLKKRVLENKSKQVAEKKNIDSNILLDENYIQTIIDNVHQTIQIPSFELASPIEDGKWKTEMYCHSVNESISSNLEFDGYILVRESNVEEYIAKRNSAFEIPVSSHKKNNVIGLRQIDAEKVGGKCVFIVPNTNYSEEIGLII